MSNAADYTQKLRETLVRACVQGPASLQRLVNEQGLVLATRFDRMNERSVLYEVLCAVVSHGAPMDVLDVLERQWPGLEMCNQHNGLTELVVMERNLRNGFSSRIGIVGYPLRTETDDRLRASFQAATRSVVQRMGTFAPGRIYNLRGRGCSTNNSSGYATIQQMALEDMAYYVYEALPNPSIEALLENAFFLNVPWWHTGISSVLPVAQDTLIRLAPAVPYEQVENARVRLLLEYQQIWDRDNNKGIRSSYERVGAFQISINLMTQELRKRRRRMAFLGMYQPVVDPQTRARSMRRNFPREVFHLVADMLCEF